MTRGIIDWTAYVFFIIVLIPIVAIVYQAAFDSFFCKRKNRKDL
jgi:hypothetical protein